MDLGRIRKDFEKYMNAVLEMVEAKTYDPSANRALGELHFAVAGGLERLIPQLRGLRHTSVYAGAIRTLLHDVTGVAQLTDNDEVTWNVEWNRLQRPTFVVTESLMASLMLTDPGKVRTADVPWPFPAFKITVPNPGCAIPVEAHSMLKLFGAVERETVRSICVLRWDQYSGDATPIYPPAGVEIVEAIRQTLATAEARRAKLTKSEAVVVRAMASGGTSVYHNQVWDAEQTVASWLKFNHAQEGEEIGDTDKRALLLAQRVAVNLALYLASEDEETRAPTWSASDKTTGRGRNWNVGGKVRVGREVREAAAEIAAGRAATCPAVKHIVRGHFRNQACGAGRQERKRIYIKPHWRGPDGAEVHERTYVVK